MDPFAHTLLGTALARSPIGRRQGLDTAALIIGANLPDLDVVAHFVSRDASLQYRRGWSHGLLALVILPLLLWLGLLAWRRIRGSSGPSAIRLLSLSTLAVASHPLLDWLNTYGVRLLFPLEPDWYYGDKLFIMDPWLWLLLGGATVLSRPRLPERNWIALAILFSIPMVLLPGALIPMAPRVIFALGLLAISVLRLRTRQEKARPAWALAGVVLAMLYIAALSMANELARGLLESELSGQGQEVLLVGPLPADPLSWDVLIGDGKSYQWGKSSWATGYRFEKKGDIAIGPESHSAVIEARRSPSVRGFVGWLRFPFYELVERKGGGWQVYMMDARYARKRTEGFGGVRVAVPAPETR